MRKTMFTVRGLWGATSIVSAAYLISRAQKAYPEFYSWVGGVLIVLALMLAGAILTKGTTRN